jgi:hypothetical protein
MDLPGIEPGTPRCKRGILPLDYRPRVISRMQIILSAISEVTSFDFLFCFYKNNYQFYFEPELVFNIFVILFSSCRR